jgi:hypothetical protein
MGMEKRNIFTEDANCVQQDDINNMNMQTECINCVRTEIIWLGVDF